MKKIMLASAMALSCSALFADTLSPTMGFEAYTAGATDLGSLTDEGGEDVTTDNRYWIYVAASGSTDGSTVKAYEATPSVPTCGVPAVFDGSMGNNYLELSTEGGTLWRGVNHASGTDATEASLGEAYSIPSDTGVYIDTMVQFTPSEDGGTPDVSAADKLAV